jgi:hypothetical protein
MNDIKEYTYDDLKKTFAIGKENLEIINKLPATSILKKIITEKFPINHIISRELCILYYMKLNFYVVKNNDNTFKSFILVSKYNLKEIEEIYVKIKKKIPKKIYYLFNKNKNINSKLL